MEEPNIFPELDLFITNTSHIATLLFVSNTVVNFPNISKGFLAPSRKSLILVLRNWIFLFLFEFF